VGQGTLAGLHPGARAGPQTWPGAYCAVTQSAHRWLGRLAAARAQAAGSTAAAQPAPADLLRQDKAAREVAALVSSWLSARQFDPAARQALATARTNLRALIAATPPRELPGCAECLARSQYLHLVAPHMDTVGTATAHRVSAAIPAGARLRTLRDLLGQYPHMTARLDGKQQRDLLYCLVTVSSTRSGSDPADLLHAIANDGDGDTA
jgi:hypothetical protein